jgi:hypothetical protein
MTRAIDAGGAGGGEGGGGSEDEGTFYDYFDGLNAQVENDL